MGKITRLFSTKSIKKDYVVSTCLSILTALFLSIFCSGLLQNKQHEILSKYENLFEYQSQQHLAYFHGKDDNDEKKSLYINYPIMDTSQLLTPLDDFAYNIFGILSVAVFPLSFLICLSVTSILFYKKLLQKPLEILDHAAASISNNDLDFQISYNRNDELGKLCASFEKMRCALWESNTALWRQMEERRRLNAAFAHDLRTPLTVLKGQSEMLLKFAPKMTGQKIIETADMMNRHILRLENYVAVMSKCQRLEHIEIQKEPVDQSSLFRQMHMTGISLCKEKQFLFDNRLPDHTSLKLDASIIMQVYENLLANAVRFADRSVTVSVSEADGCFKITVSDDGAGFTAEALTEAVKPFYRSSKETDGTHLGMGLNICSILCEKHGGFLKLENKDGAQVTAAFRS